MVEFRSPIVAGLRPFSSCRRCKRGIACDINLSSAAFKRALRDEGWTMTTGRVDTCPACRVQKAHRKKDYWQRKYIDEPHGMPFAYHCTDHRKPYKVRYG